ncbi:unnamed protein product [Pedinophyceae sp. YPF-701]|nr:unnamed protein product [Pedinophyceae sp. YPF-701]
MYRLGAAMETLGFAAGAHEWYGRAAAVLRRAGCGHDQALSQAEAAERRARGRVDETSAAQLDQQRELAWRAVWGTSRVPPTMTIHPRVVSRVTPERGRELSRAVKMADATSQVWLREDPACAVVAKSLRSALCHFCLRELPGHMRRDGDPATAARSCAVPCPRCAVHWYCSPACLTAALTSAWAERECGRPFSALLPEEALLAGRLAVAVHSAPRSGVQGEWPGERLFRDRGVAGSADWARCVESLQSDSGVKDLEQRVRDATVAAVVARCYELRTEGEGLAATTQVLSMLGRIEVNGVSVQSAARWPPVGSRGIALYPAVALCNHSCLANAELAFSDDFCVELRSLSCIEAGQCAINISYGPQAGEYPTYLRRKLLHLQYGFWCRCDACCAAEAPARDTTEDADVSDPADVIAMTRALVSSLQSLGHVSSSSEAPESESYLRRLPNIEAQMLALRCVGRCGGAGTMTCDVRAACDAAVPAMLAMRATVRRRLSPTEETLALARASSDAALWRDARVCAGCGGGLADHSLLRSRLAALCQAVDMLSRIGEAPDPDRVTAERLLQEVMAFLQGGVSNLSPGHIAHLDLWNEAATLAQATGRFDDSAAACVHAAICIARWHPPRSSAVVHAVQRCVDAMGHPDARAYSAAAARTSGTWPTSASSAIAGAAPGSRSMQMLHVARQMLLAAVDWARSEDRGAGQDRGRKKGAA